MSLYIKNSLDASDDRILLEPMTTYHKGVPLHYLDASQVSKFSRYRSNKVVFTQIPAQTVVDIRQKRTKKSQYEF